MTAIRKLAGNFTEADVDGEIIVMRLDSGELLSLVDSAAAAWRLIDGSRDRAALAQALEAQYDADERRIAEDLSELLEQLQQAGLIAQD